MNHSTFPLPRIKQLQTEILRAAPYRDIGLVPNPGASAAAIAAAERRLARRLPPSYRAFLAQHDGWPRFFEGATLLGTASLGKRMYQDLAGITFDAAPPLAPHLAHRARSQRPQLIPFAADLAGSTLFAFDPAVTRADGEYEVVAWLNEIGVRRESFSDFLDFIVELCESELAALAAPTETRRSA